MPQGVSEARRAIRRKRDKSNYQLLPIRGGENFVPRNVCLAAAGGPRKAAVRRNTMRNPKNPVTVAMLVRAGGGSPG